MTRKLVISAVALLAGMTIFGFTVSPTNQPDTTVRPAPSHDSFGPLVSVNASSSVTSAPDRVRMSIGTVAVAVHAENAISSVNATMSELIDEIKRLNLPGVMIQTSAVQVWPQYGSNRNDQPPRIENYRASNTVTVRFDDVGRTGDLFDLAAKAGANQINGPSFELKDNDGAQRDALRQAVAQAKRKVQAIAEEMDMQIVRFEEIHESGSDRPQPVYRAEAMTMRGGQTLTPVEGGEIETSASVTIIARLGTR